MPHCLITGGAGFVGSHLATRLVRHGWRVRILDDLSTGKARNIEHLGNGVDVRVGSILDSVQLADAMKGIDVVFHHAALVSVPQSVVEPERCHELCATGTLRVLMAAAGAGARRLVYAASSSAYGGDVRCPIDEREPVLALSPYAAGKLAGEHYCSSFAALGKLETVRLRYFNIFGPRQDPSSPYSGVISIFATRMLKGERPTIYGDGSQSRDFIFVEDIAQANELAATTPDVSGRVFNIGRGERIDLIALVNGMNEVLGTSIEPIFAPPRIGDVRDSQANITAARQSLGFDPKVRFLDGLAQTIEYYRQRI